jgi:hypothetical protein
MTSDRRTRRAHAPLLALEYFLDAERERSGASALGVFLDSEPLVVSAEESASGLLLTELLVRRLDLPARSLCARVAVR